jgi:Sec-independent protein secretion pathway component TatC
LIFAPLAAWAALERDRSALNHAERIDSLVVSFSAAALFILGVVFSILLIVHWIG